MQVPDIAPVPGVTGRPPAARRPARRAVVGVTVAAALTLSAGVAAAVAMPAPEPAVAALVQRPDVPASSAAGPRAERDRALAPVSTALPADVEQSSEPPTAAAVPAVVPTSAAPRTAAPRTAAPAAPTAAKPAPTTAAPAPKPAAPAPAQGSLTPAEYAAQVLADVNAVRRSHGLAALSDDACADRYAQPQAQRMAAQGTIWHQDLHPFLDACGGTKAAENVATSPGSPQQVVDAWMASSGHRANILDPQLHSVGTGAARGSDGRWYVCQDFLG